jgi:glutamate dehydrogenase/leucine dehydrogenase
VAISGFGNVAWGAALKASQMGAKVVSISGPDGYVYDENGISGEKIDYMWSFGQVVTTLFLLMPKNLASHLFQTVVLGN